MGRRRLKVDGPPARNATGKWLGRPQGISLDGGQPGTFHAPAGFAPAQSLEVIAKPPKTSHAKFAKYAKFCFMDDFANLADFA